MTDVDQIPSDGLSAGPRPSDLTEHSRTGMSAAALQRAINDHLRYSIGRPAAARKSAPRRNSPFDDRAFWL